MLSRRRTRASRLLSLYWLTLLLAVGILSASSEWHPNADPAQWSGDEVYRILHDSPWTKTAKVSFSSTPISPLDRETPASNRNPNGGDWGNGGGQMPGTMGGMGGRRGMGGTGTNTSSGTYGTGGARTDTTIPDAPGGGRSRPAEVTVQWESALPVRLAAAKKAGGSDANPENAADHYVIAVIGLPVVAMGGPAASLDSDTTLSPEDTRRMAERVKSSASLLRSGHDAITPDKVEVGQGADGRVLLYFPKSDAITLRDKTVEFRLAMGHTDLRKKFSTKDMEFGGKLDL